MILAIRLLPLFFLFANATEHRRLEGRISLWRSFCQFEAPTCELPKPIGVSWPAVIEFEVPLQTGRHLVAEQTFSAAGYEVGLSLYWVALETPGVSYIVTQTTLKNGSTFVAQCSRFDATDAFEFLPPGACGGREPRNDSQEAILGVSLIHEGQ